MIYSNIQVSYNTSFSSRSRFSPIHLFLFIILDLSAFSLGSVLPTNVRTPTGPVGGDVEYDRTRQVFVCLREVLR